MKKRKIIKKNLGQTMVEYVILIQFCVLVFLFQSQLILAALDDYAQGFYWMLQNPWP